MDDSDGDKIIGFHPGDPCLTVLAAVVAPRTNGSVGGVGGIMSITDAPDTYEGNGAGEYTKAIFAVSCVWSGSATATVEYHTYPGTATEGKDYVRARGTLTFMSTNHNPQQIMGKIICDKDREPTETFDVKLSNPQNGSLGASKVGQARILDDDGRVPTRRVD